jgi:hypothetical protein
MLGRIDKELLKELQKTNGSSTKPQPTGSVDFKAVLQGAITSDNKTQTLPTESKDSLMRAMDMYLSKSKIDDTNIFPATGNTFPSSGFSADMPALTLDGSSLLRPGAVSAKTPDVGGTGNSATRMSNNPQSSQSFERTQANNTYKLVPGGTAAPSKPEFQDDNNAQNWGIAEAPKASPKGSKLDKYDRYINESASAYGLDPALIKAVIVAESGGNANARSRSGARGLMQLMPATAAELGVSNSYDPKQNIKGGSRYLRQLLDRYNGDLRQTLAAYNWGMGNLERKPDKMPQGTKNYIAKVEGYYKGYSEDPSLA